MHSTRHAHAMYMYVYYTMLHLLYSVFLYYDMSMHLVTESSRSRNGAMSAGMTVSVA